MITLVIPIYRHNLMPSSRTSSLARLFEVGLIYLALFIIHFLSSLLIIQPMLDCPRFPREAPSKLSLYHLGRGGCPFAILPANRVPSRVELRRVN